jgi:hypothetical protein
MVRHFSTSFANAVGKWLGYNRENLSPSWKKAVEKFTEPGGSAEQKLGKIEEATIKYVSVFHMFRKAIPLTPLTPLTQNSRRRPCPQVPVQPRRPGGCPKRAHQRRRWYQDLPCLRGWHWDHQKGWSARLSNHSSLNSFGGVNTRSMRRPFWAMAIGVCWRLVILNVILLFLSSRLSYLISLCPFFR